MGWSSVVQLKLGHTQNLWMGLDRRTEDPFCDWIGLFISIRIGGKWFSFQNYGISQYKILRNDWKPGFCLEWWVMLHAPSRQWLGIFPVGLGLEQNGIPIVVRKLHLIPIRNSLGIKQCPLACQNFPQAAQLLSWNQAFCHPRVRSNFKIIFNGSYR